MEKKTLPIDAGMFANAYLTQRMTTSSNQVACWTNGFRCARRVRRRSLTKLTGNSKTIRSLISGNLEDVIVILTYVGMVMHEFHMSRSGRGQHGITIAAQERAGKQKYQAMKLVLVSLYSIQIIQLKVQLDLISYYDACILYGDNKFGGFQSSEHLQGPDTVLSY